MSREFDLFSLSKEEDIHPRSWICLRGNNLFKIISDLELEVLDNKGLTKNSLSIEISRKFNCSVNTINAVLCGRKKSYPIPIILELLKKSRNGERFKKKILKETTELKVNSASSKPVAALRVVSKNLAKIIGAFVADGSLSIQTVFETRDLKNLKELENKINSKNVKYSKGEVRSRNKYYIAIQLNKSNRSYLLDIFKCFSQRFGIQHHYEIEIVDGHKRNVELFCEWVNDEFNLYREPKEKNKKRAWEVLLSNKIISRYLTEFLGFWPGPKTFNVDEPPIIKKSPLNIRKEFAKGVLMFDGCVIYSGIVKLTVISRKLSDSIKDIWDRDGIKYGVGTTVKRRTNSFPEFSIFTTSDNDIDKITPYFEKSSPKYELLKWLKGDKYEKSSAIDNIEKIGSSYNRVLSAINKTKSCDLGFLCKACRLNFISINTIVKILHRQGKINLSKNPSFISKYISEETTILLNKKIHNLLFERVKSRCSTYKDCATLLGVHKSTVSAWKKRKSRISLKYINRMCKISSYPHLNILKGVIETDRRIVEKIN